MSATNITRQIKRSLTKEIEKGDNMSVEAVEDMLRRLDDCNVTFQVLVETKIGRDVSKLKKNNTLRVQAKALVTKWRNIVAVAEQTAAAQTTTQVQSDGRTVRSVSPADIEIATGVGNQAKPSTLDSIKADLKQNGYALIQVLTEDEVEMALQSFYEWKATIPDHDNIHKKIDPHGIYKHHEAGHQWHAWYVRTRPNVQRVFATLWNTNSLVSSFDGSCFLSGEEARKDAIWTHSDQAANKAGLHCYQAFVSLTDNEQRTCRLYEGSHNLHRGYFEERVASGEVDPKNVGKDWQLIDHATLDRLEDCKRVLRVKRGEMVIWDSRTFHQNQYGLPNCGEERIVQYVCMLPKNGAGHTAAMKKKRWNYFKTLRTTSHWPYPVKVNSKQARTYGDQSLVIDYDSLRMPNLDDLRCEIERLI